jgi:hypothetical protein
MNMAKKNKQTPGNLQSLRIGSRVRCTDDGVEGRIVWANAVAVKIKWDDGEQVTWKRDSLAERPIQIIDPDKEVQTEAPAEPPAEAPAPEGGADIITAGEPTTEPDPEGVAAETDDVATDAPALNPVIDDLPAAADRAPAFYLPPPEPESEPAAPVQTPADEEALAVPAPKRQRKAPAPPKEKKVSALDAAARVLAEEGKPMSCKEMIGAMAAKGYWSSPGGKTPDATLCSAILRELATKGDKARFQKVGPGRFAYRAQA